MPFYVVEDEEHSEWIGEFETLDEALAELRRIAELPWGQRPNVAPCMSWRSCHRVFALIASNASSSSSAEDWRVWPLETSASGAVWSPEFPGGHAPQTEGPPSRGT